MDYPLLLITLGVFAGGAAAGMREYRRLTTIDTRFALKDFHRKPGALRWVLAVLTVMSAIGLCVSFQRTALYRIPEWLDLSLYDWAHGLGAALLGILGGLGWRAWRREKTPDTRALVLTASLCLTALLICQFATLRYAANRLSDLKYSGQFMLQSSSSSCAAASGANVAGLLGLRY